jgi:hypothetical protein
LFISLGVLAFYQASSSAQVAYAAVVLLILGLTYILIKRHYKAKYELV